MYEIGRLWQTNQITVAREHMATAITQYVMAQLFPLLGQSEGASRGRVVVAGVQGELHQIGAMMVSDVLESDGWQVRFLGSNMPHSGILETMEQEAASVLCISTTILSTFPNLRTHTFRPHAFYWSKRCSWWCGIQVHLRTVEGCRCRCLRA